MKSLIATVSLLALVGAVPASAQTTSTPTSRSQALQSGTSQLNQEDRSFVRQAAIGGMAETQMGKLAEQRASDPAVRVFGRWMATDHALVGQMLTNIARHDGLSPPQSLDQQHQAMMQKLDGLEGEQFDRAYVPLQVEAHRQTIALFQSEAKSGENPRLRTFAERIVPTLQQHLAAAEELRNLPAVASSGTGATVGSGSSMPPRSTASDAATQRLNRQELNRTRTTQ
jgi:putative membrane protein